ncbi:MAG: TadE/TadG family type IV pilus assembly protein [Dehalococcoidia bacterium]
MNENTMRHTTPKRGRLAPFTRRKDRQTIGERGQALVEFAFVSIIFFILVFGIIDFGLGLHSWITVTNASREGARLGAVHATQGEIVTQVQNSAKNLDPTDLTITVTNADPNSDHIGEPITVKVDYTYDLITPLVGILNLSSINITSTAEMRLE